VGLFSTVQAKIPPPRTTVTHGEDLHMAVVAKPSFSVGREQLLKRTLSLSSKLLFTIQPHPHFLGVKV